MAASTAVAQRAGRRVERTQLFQKTELCKFYEKKKCKKGSKCPFAHGVAELAAKPDFAKTRFCTTFMETGRCDDTSCKFAHSRDEIRANYADRVVTSIPPVDESRQLPPPPPYSTRDAFQPKLAVKPPTNAWSRQSTEEPCDSPLTLSSFSRQTTDSSWADMEDSDDEFELQSGQNVVEHVEDDEGEWHLLVKNSFLHFGEVGGVRAVEARCCGMRRAQSFPLL